MIATGCATMQQEKEVEVIAVPGAEVINGSVVFEGIGMSAVTDLESPLGMVKAKAAAAAIARANLLEVVKGAEISSGITVKEMAYESSSVESKVHGWLSRAKISYIEEEEEGRETRLGEKEAKVVKAKATLTLERGDLKQLLPETYSIAE